MFPFWFVGGCAWILLIVLLSYILCCVMIIRFMLCVVYMLLATYCLWFLVVVIGLV